MDLRSRYMSFAFLSVGYDMRMRCVLFVAFAGDMRGTSSCRLVMELLKDDLEVVR
jgi:hypothetical protein